MSDVKHWAEIKETGTEIGMKILVAAYRVGGNGLFKVFLFPVMIFYFCLRADARKASRDFQSRVRRNKGDRRRVTLLDIFAHFWQFGLALIDKIRVWSGDISRNDLVIHRPEVFETVHRAGKGGVLILSHLGNSEVLSALSQQHNNVKLNILHYSENAEKFNRILGKYHQSDSVEFIQVTDINIQLAVRLSQKIANGEFVAIAGDRIPVRNAAATVSCQFLGERAPFPKGPFILAQILSVPLIMMTCLDQAEGYNLYFDSISQATWSPRDERDSNIHKTAQVFAALLEQYAIQEPLQWFNFFEFWHHPSVEQGAQA